MERFGKYRIERKVAIGGMAEIFLGRTGSGVPVAIKKIHPNLSSKRKFVQMFLDEARIAVSLFHPNIVQMLDFGKIESTYFFSLEWVDGKSLGEIILRQVQIGVPVPVDVALFIVLEVCKALEYAHSRTDRFNRPLGIVHRDISPPNIMVTREGLVKLADFGIAYVRGKTVQTQPGIIRGKFSYMSPEQASGQVIDHRSDLFSLGVVLYEFLTSTRLFLRDQEQETLEAVRRCQITPLGSLRSGLSQRVVTVVHKMLASAPRLRYAQTKELRRTIQGILLEEYPQTGRDRVVSFLQTLFPDEQFGEPALPVEVSVCTVEPQEGHPGTQSKLVLEFLVSHPFLVSLGLGMGSLLLAEILIRTF